MEDGIPLIDAISIAQLFLDAPEQSQKIIEDIDEENLEGIFRSQSESGIDHMTKRHGIGNLGVTCFLNSILQLLYIGFFPVIAAFDIDSPDAEGNEVDDFLKALKYVFMLLYTKNLNRPMSINMRARITRRGVNVMSKDISLYTALYDKFKETHEGGEQDDNEYLVHLLGLIDGSSNSRVRELSKLYSFNMITINNLTKFEDFSHLMPEVKYKKERENILRLQLLKDDPHNLKDDLLPSLFRRKPFKSEYEDIAQYPYHSQMEDTPFLVTDGEFQLVPELLSCEFLFIHLHRAMHSGEKKKTKIRNISNIVIGKDNWQLIGGTFHLGDTRVSGHYCAISPKHFRADSVASQILSIDTVIDDSIVKTQADKGLYPNMFNPEYFSSNFSTLLYRKSRVETRPGYEYGVIAGNEQSSYSQFLNSPQIRGLTVVTPYKSRRKYMKYKLKYLKLKKMLANQ